MGLMNHLKYFVINPVVVDRNDQPFEIPCDQPLLELIRVMNFFISFSDDRVAVFDFHIPLDKRIRALK